MTSHHSLLIVDDEPHILKALNRVLHSDRYTLHTVGSAEEALALMEREPPSVLLTDQRMPGKSGTALLAEVAQRYPDVVGLLMSGYADFDSLTEAVNDGQIYKFVLKPWDNAELRQSINDLFTQIELGEEGLRAQRRLKAEKEALEQRLSADERPREAIYNRYEHLFNEVPVALVMTDPEGEILDYNAAFGALVDVRHSLIGKTVDDWLPDDIRRRLAETDPDDPLTISIEGVNCSVAACLLHHGPAIHHVYVVTPR